VQRIVKLIAIIAVSFLVSVFANYYPLYALSVTTASSNSTGSTINEKYEVLNKYYNVTAQNKVKLFSNNDTQVTVISNHTNGTAPFIPLTKYEPTFKVINITKTEGNITNPQIATSGKNVYIAYGNDVKGKLDVYVVASRDYGVNYDPPISLSMNLTGNSTNYEIGAAGDTVYIIFENNGTGNGDIFYSVTFDAGETWSIYNLSKSPDPSYDSSLSVDDKGEGYITWVEKHNSTTLYAYCTRWCW
jgi:hypothetical protein